VLQRGTKNFQATRELLQGAQVSGGKDDLIEPTTERSPWGGKNGALTGTFRPTWGGKKKRNRLYVGCPDQNLCAETENLD